ncbi:MAG: NADH-quinone oxidoreductase subunit NuoB [Lentisphaerae bacterium]|nr:NADH-quinone oxidoreductase subunit NuoB [Lentisphaerota bacterium]
MWNSLKARLFQGYRTGKFPYVPPQLPENFAGRPEVFPEKCSSCGKCRDICPTGAVREVGRNLSIDTGKCIFCGKCAGNCPEAAVTMSREYRLAAMERDALIADGTAYMPQRPTDRKFLKFCGNSLKIRQVSAGGCAACELDFNVLNTLAWDMGRFGIQVVASPRHADCILVTGPVSDNMLLALKKSYDAAPRPVWVIACGTCAVSGGIYAGSAVVHDGVEKILKPDLYVPGCPPHPATLLEGILRLMDKKL